MSAGSSVGRRPEDGDHLFRRLADAEAAEGVAGKIHRRQSGGAMAAQFEVRPALDDGEQRLIGPAVGGAAAFGPMERAAHGLAQHLRRRLERRALVETHGHVGAEVFLDGDGPFGRQFEEAAVDVRTEDGGVVGDLARRARGCRFESRRCR